jgi:tetratricopeptide (TPR) repeat protein
MPESRRLPLSHEDEAARRDRHIDELLDDGLDLYFGGRYAEAIHLWTRVLFLDRSHARARAYIERARTAQAEVQRRSDEWLQASRELLDRGETADARRLLTQVVEATGDDLQAAALRVHLERLERLRATGDPAVRTEPAPAPPARWTWRRPARHVLGAGLGLVLTLTLAILFVQSGADPETAVSRVAVPAPSQVRWPVLSSSEVALVRARTSYSRGWLAQALRDLNAVAPDSPDRAAADQLRIEIQQLLLASVRSNSANTLTEPIRR